MWKNERRDADSIQATIPEGSEYEKKKQSFITRTIWTLVMIGGFFISMFSGHVYVIMIITAVQIISFKEVIAIANVPSKARNLRFTKTLNWYFLGTTMYYLYGESLIYYFKHILLVDKVLGLFATHHRFISFMLYVIGRLLEKERSKANYGLTHVCRLRLFCHVSGKGSLQVSVLSICVESYGIVLDCLPSTFYHEQCL